MHWSKTSRLLPLAIALGLTLAASGCKKDAASNSTTASTESGQLAPANSPWQQSVDAFMVGWFERNPAQAAING